MKIYKFIFIVILFFISCSKEENQIISNVPSDLPDKNYKINLWSSNSGENIESVTIYWDQTDGIVELYETGELLNTTTNSYTFTNMDPGEFRDIKINVTTDDSTYTDSIQIFTRPVFSVSNFRYEIEMVMRGNQIYDLGESYIDLGNGQWDEGESYTDLDGNGQWDEGESYTDLGNGEWNQGETFVDIEYPNYHRIIHWSMTNEVDENFKNYTLYRVANNNVDALINPENCNCEIAILPKIDTVFIDSSVYEESGIYAYFYQLQVKTEYNNRNSFIYNYTNFTPPPKILLDELNISNNNNGFIQITWDPIINSDYFYQYEIWKASEENLDDLHNIAIIIDPEQGKFMDRNVGNGTTWYYSIAVVDINGQREYSNFISGWSMP